MTGNRHRTRGFQTTVMRGGTSRALVFLESDLPEGLDEQDRLFLTALGCPDPHGRQVDGLGGASSSTNKVAIVAPSPAPGFDVDFTFAQLAPDRDFVDRAGNCGNISSAIGPFAVDEELVEAVDPVTTVAICTTNTRQRIVAHVPTRNGRFDPTGTYEIAGVPGSGSRVVLEFEEPAGSVTGSLLPTGRPRDVLEVPAVGRVEVSLVDAGNPVVFVAPGDLGLVSDVTPAQIDADARQLAKIEAVRCAASVAMGIARDPAQALTIPSIPKLIFLNGRAGDSDGDGDLVVVGMSMGRTHRALQLTGAVCTAAAAAIAGTLVHDELQLGESDDGDGVIRITHPSGQIELGATIRRERDETVVERISASRTARRIMDGVVYGPADS